MPDRTGTKSNKYRAAIKSAITSKKVKVKNGYLTYGNIRAASNGGGQHTIKEVLNDLRGSVVDKTSTGKWYYLNDK